MYKGQLKDFPKEVVERMLECQAEQGNDIDVQIFEDDRTASAINGGFDWKKTIEGSEFWIKVIFYRDFSVFDALYKKIPRTPDYNSLLNQIKELEKDIDCKSILITIDSSGECNSFNVKKHNNQ